MKTLLLTCAAVVAIASPVVAQSNKSEIRDGVRYLVPKDESTMNAEANLVQNRTVDLGFFNWPVPTEKVAAGADRPRNVSYCEGHDPDYTPAPDVSSEGDPRIGHTKLTKTFIYEWSAYRNAIVAKDCSCGSLKADWNEAESDFDTITKGVTNTFLFSNAILSARNAIKRDFDRMCDISMRLE